MLEADYQGTPAEGLWAEVHAILAELEDHDRWDDSGELACLVQRLRSVLATLAEDF